MIEAQVNPYKKHINKEDKGEHVNNDDVREIVSYCNKYVTDAKAASYAVIENMFRAGSIAARNNSTITQDELAKALRINIKDLELAIAAARRFNYREDELQRYCESNNIGSWVSLKNHIYPSKNVRTVASDLRARLYAAIKEIDEGGENAQDFEKILTSALRHVPIKREIADRLHIKYNRCVCCKDEPPPEGHEYIYRSEIDMYVPICKRCNEIDAAVDLVEVAKMYGTYAINMEAAFDKMYLNDNENGYYI